jgi:exodeoxyribonuclease VII large subunit
MPDRPANKPVYAVSELAEILRALIEDSLPSVWVQGEISNFSRPASGHWYFTLKDDRAQLRCAMFKGSNFYVRPQPRDGDAVMVRARVDIYPARGELQLVVEHLEAAGTGALLRAFEALKARLGAEGLFDAAIKQPIPLVPRIIGVITSGTGAALQDILNTLARRWPLAQVALYPVPVQGKDAPPAIVRALRELPLRAPADVILLARGGGSIEDLWAFNDEAVARAIRACTVPVISGVGHEIDFTIADFAADLRAATPTAAAELATPDIADWAARAATAQRDLADALRSVFLHSDSTVTQLDARLRNLHPGRRLLERAHRLDELHERLRHAMTLRLKRQREQAGRVIASFGMQAPTARIADLKIRLGQLENRLQTRSETRRNQLYARLETAAALLNSLNPLAVLGRGYAVATRSDGSIVRDASQLELGEAVRLRLGKGSATTQVRRVYREGTREK